MLLTKSRSMIPVRAFAARSVAGRPVRMTAGRASVGTTGTHSTPAGSAPAASISGPQRSVSPATGGRHIRIGMSRYMKHRTEGHTETTISGDTRADWSEAFEIVSSLEVVYVWHASVFTREVWNGLDRIGFLYPQQIIWDKGRTVLTRTHYWYQHEPCLYMRKKNAPWYGKAGENSTVWSVASPKFIMGGSDEEKFDHPTQKPMEVMRRPILNHTLPGEAVYDCFLGSGTTLIAAEQTGRVCYGVEIDPKYVDCIIRRWQLFTGKHAVLDGDGRTFDEVAGERRQVPA